MTVDAGFDVDIDTTRGRQAPPAGKGKGKGKRAPVSFQDFYKRYDYVANLIATYPELQEYYKQILDYANKHRGQMPPENVLKEFRARNAWFQARNSTQQEFDIAQQDPNLKQDVQTAINLNKQKILNWSATRGIEIPADKIDELARDATRNKWADDDVQLEKNLSIFIGRAVEAGRRDLRGTAGDFQTDLLSWAKKNGITLSDSAAAQYIERLTFNRQTLDDAKQEIRNTYMLGAYPAWAEQIKNGLDPDSIVSPYRSAASQLLEIPEEELGWNDNIIKKAMQGVGPDGKPGVVPLWEYERMVRQDPRWQKTDNAYRTYTDVGTAILRTFGFR